MSMPLLTTATLLLSGLLAGEELVIRYGVQPAFGAMTDRSGLEARQALIARLRVLVPVMMLPALGLSIATVVFQGAEPGLALRWAGTLSMIAFVMTSFTGTVPINIRVFDWDLDAPPANWKRVIGQWAMIDVFRSSFAILSFGCFVLAAVQ